MTATDTIGLVAAFLTTAAFLPQALMVLRTGRTEAISLAMYLMFTAGVGAWLGYGVLIGLLPVMVANAITLMLAVLILAMKVRSLRGPERIATA
ncbi:MAG: SemiSWEET transporter [Pseudomonadota bacterium]